MKREKGIGRHATGAVDEEGFVSFTDQALLYDAMALSDGEIWNRDDQMFKVLLSRYADEEKHFRDQSADALCYWLKKNKAKTVRMNWGCPAKPVEKIALKCGLRPDNLCLAYDSMNLPNTEEKWNSTLFMSKQHGCYKWPP
ncbi:unnamed protein product [Cylicostephanus goldi]|uniref:Proteasome activator complex subunit 4-like HEAT repeat-like domain-containing protein n=1 Tax=Cylicostephanus goldi TaxID=71465 RepID=A0A3P6RPK8_CYLGO|nr:unnamed protein product [Cylicostephanus goldi]